MKQVLGLILALALGGCGIPPNNRILTRAPSYLAALSLAHSTGYPLDIPELERKFPELKGIVITAAQWVDEFDDLQKEAKEKKTSVYEYRIPFGANVTIEVTGEPNLTRTYTIPPSGWVHYPYVDRLRIAGLTLDELKDDVEKELSAYLRRPEVLVHLNATPSYVATPEQPAFVQPTFGAPGIIVLGVSNLPHYQQVQFTGKETLTSVLGITGIPERAEWRQIRVIRRDAKDPLRKSRVIVCDLWDYVAKGDVRQDIPLFPGDVVFVPLRWSADDQFWEDWSYVKRILADVFFLDTFRDGLKKGGELRK